jgi:signal transduction histidine kinase
VLLLKVLLLAVAGLANLICALVILSRGRKIDTVSFFVLALAMSGWAIGIAGFLLTKSDAAAFAWAKMYYFCPPVIAASLVIFTLAFPGTNRVSRGALYVTLAGFLALELPLVIFHSFLTTQLVHHGWGKEIALNLAEYIPYGAYLLVCFGASLIIMYRKSRRLTGLYAVQAQFFYYGFLVAAAFGVFFNYLLPGFGNYQLIWIGPLFTTVFVAAIAINIVRHAMFDIRATVARSLSYGAALALLMALYGFIVFTLARLLFHIQLSVGVQVFFSIATGITGIFFSHIRHLFDKATNRFFYQDAYEPQELFDTLNKVLVSSADLRQLLQQSSRVLANYLKADYCAIGVRETGANKIRIFGTRQMPFSETDIAAVRRLTPRMHQSVIATDFLENSHNELRQILVRNNVAVLVRLTPNLRKAEEGIGYLVLGPRKSGGAYIGRDYRTLDTIAGELIIAIQNALRFEEIENFNLTLQQRVDEATRKMRRTNEKLKALDEAKDDFVSMASHQLRTPLTSIKGYTSMVLEGDAGPINKTQRELLQQAFFSSQRMVYLIADLLNVSRLKTGKFLIEANEVNLADLVEQEISQLKDTAAGRQLTLTYEKPEKFPSLTLDETKTRQVIMNFVDNAIYYTPAGGHIAVKLQETPTTVELRVVDNGIGVPKVEQPHLFTKFYRAGNARKARPDGTGLGLFMAKKVIVAEGGAIIFETEEGKGSTFGFVFPKKLT